MPRDFSDTSKPIKPPPEPRRRPKQDRSKMMVDSIVEACIRILDREGADRLTTNRIAEVAGVSKASLYRYFPNKEAIVAAVFDQILTGNLARHDEWERQWSKMSLEESVAFLIDLMLSLDRRLVRLHRSFYQAYQRSFDPNRDKADLVVNAMRDRLAENSHRLRTKNVDMAALILTRGMRALIWEVAEERPEYLESEALREELLRLFQSYLMDPVTH